MRVLLARKNFLAVSQSTVYTVHKIEVYHAPPPPPRSSLPSPNVVTVGDHGHLLTGNSTPAVTPGSDVNQSLGQHSETPASTPTELHDLLPQPTDASPYQEIHLNGSARVPTTVGSSQEQSTTFGQGTDNRPPLPRHPLPVHVPNPPRVGVVCVS